MKKTWRKIASSVLAFTLLAGSFTCLIPAGRVQAETPDAAVQQEFYVAVNGSDSNSGSKESPFATVERARRAVDEVNDDMTGDIIVNIGAGDYYLEDTVTFGPEDSGTNGYEVIYRSADGAGKANLIGGERITGWKPVEQEDVDTYDLDASLLGKVYKVQLDPEKYDFNTLYVNDQRATMARTKNRDNNPYFPMAKGEYMRSTGGHNNNLNMFYNASELDQKAIDGMVHAQERGEEEIAQVFVWDGGDWDWFTNTVPIASIDTAKNEFKFPTPPEDYPEKYRTKYNIGSGARYFLQGNLAFMDVEGEYHYNKTTGILYYYPKAEDGAMEEQTIVVPTMQIALYFKGAEKANLADEPNPDQQVHNITIDGLAVKDTEFADYFTYSWNWGDTDAGIGYYPKAAEGSTNPSFCETTDREEFRVGSITLTGTHDITITDTRVKNSGLYGIIYAGDNQYSTLTNSVIENTGYGGLIFDGGYPAIGKYNNHNTVENVLIHEVGELVGHAVGLTVMSSGQNNFTNMEIYDTPKRAILVIGGFRRNPTADANYDEIRDMYTVGNHFKYIHVHDAQQDAGEDSAVFLSWLLSGRDVQRLHGSNDPNDLKTNLEGIDTTIDRYNYFDQMLITDIGADPSVIEKCTVGGLDTAMGASGSQFSNIKAANTQHHLLAIRDRDGGGYGDMYGMENCTNNLYTDDYLKTFDESKMEYDKIGLTASFPEEYRVAKRVYPDAPDDLYFYDDFEASRQLDLTKWTVEKGNLEMHIGYGYMSEDPLVGKRSLPINADLNPNGIVVSRTFENELNKIVEVKYLDRRKDYANNDRGDAVPTEILPNSFLRVDDGETALGLGAVGSQSKDYYFIKKGYELIRTDVKRCFGWHTFKLDYSSGVDVKLYIDDELVATYDESDGVATSFDYIGMGDWEGKGGKAFFDQLYVYGGKEAPPVEDLPLPTPPEQPEQSLFEEDFESDSPVEFSTQKGNAEITFVPDPENAENTVMHVSSPDDFVYYADGMDWANYTFECRIMIDQWGVGGGSFDWDNMSPVWNAGSQDSKGNFNRYALKYRRAYQDFALYRRDGSDTDVQTSAAPDDYEGKWHDYKITYTDGLITAYVDGEQIFEYTDSANPFGTIGFDGISVAYYVDDIKVTRQKTPNPTASMEEGSYPGPIEVELIPQLEGQDIFYTLDGSDPTDSAHGQYYVPESAIQIAKSATLKFAAIMDGALYSDVVEKTYTIEEGSSEADKTALKALYEAVKDMVQGSYSEESWQAFQSALSEAQAVLENASAGQAEVDAAFTALLQARDGLEREVNKELLKAIIKIAEETDTTGCTPSSVQALKEALASGRALLEDENAGQQQINEAVGAIHAALVNLVDQADKTALEALLEEASKLTEGKYTAASWEKLKNAKEAAQVVLENADATPQEVEEAYDALLDALVGLELIPVDKSNLKVAINLAKPIVAEADRYVATTIEGLSELLSEAEALYADEEATQEKVDEMAQRLLSASSQARLKANKTALKEAVEQAEGIDLSQYTEASAKVFSAALAKANGILADESLTEDDQALVDQATSALRTAIDGLVKEGASDPDVSKPGESSQPGEPEEPSTGDSSPVLLIALFAGISALAILLLRRKRVRA